MNNKRKYWQGEDGMSLIEALVATAIVGIAFVGVYGLVAMSEKSMRESVAKQKLQMQANQIMDIIDGDVDNIDNYDGIDLTDCVDPAGATDKYLVRSYEWCSRLEGEVGEAGDDDIRSIEIETLVDNRKVVHLQLETFGGTVQIVMKRVYSVP
ncbi:prepilin-type N-terminal cleavage/methylation domain-containing protein [Rickettsiales bacterium]|nr:prepilin-type N-terminal cleavage/methylation domain-containing protein [Rickettsiales bacterium]